MECVMMSLDALADEIAAQAKAEAKALTTEAVNTAKSVEKEAEAEVAEIRDTLMSRAEREASQLSTELVASSRQNNQKRELIARASELDATWEAVKAEVGSAKLSGRAALIKALVADAKKEGSGMTLRPVSIDRKVLEKEAKSFDFGTDIDGLGGFTLESTDGSIVLDYRFDSRLEDAWKTSLGTVNDTLFGN
jgi:vacuolar-type H+-ATPase subunit E/Vma4